jgi:hypothetical protein
MTPTAKRVLHEYVEAQRLVKGRAERAEVVQPTWTDYMVMLAVTHGLAFVLGLIAGGLR